MSSINEAFLPAGWAELSGLVDQLLDAPEHHRASLLDSIADGLPGRRADLQALLAACERDFPLLDRPAIERFDQLLDPGPEPALPDLLGGRYRLEREIGRGGMAQVHLAQDLTHSRRVAVKVIRTSIDSSPGRERFLREIAIAARLRHPHIMPLFDSGQDDDLLYFVMPYEQGESLKTRLTNGGPLPLAAALACLTDVAHALVHAHQHGVVHRDIKPGNVLLSGDGAIVVDFGIAKALAEGQRLDDGEPEELPAAITMVGSALGTPAYMSPEQWVGDPAIDHRTDIYSFGCLAYEVLSGIAPFAESGTPQVTAARQAGRPTPLSRHRPDVPEAVTALIDRCLEIDPIRRPQEARELLPPLAAASGGGTPLPAPGTLHWRSVVLGACGVLALMIAILAGVLLLTGGR